MLILLSIILYLVSRLPNLILQPIFCDEATYLDWGWRMVTSGVPFHSLYDAKQPLLMWFFGFSQKIFSDPLIAGRLVSVVTGLFTLSGLYLLTKYLFDKKIALISSISYSLVPLFLLYDRQALMESAIAAVGIWSAYFLIHLLDKPSLKYTFLFGTTLALGFWIKSSSLIFIVTELFIYTLFIILNPSRILRINQLILAISIAIILLIPLFLQSQFWALYLKYNAQYSLSLSEMLRFPVSHWLTNLYANLQISLFNLSTIFLLFPFGLFLSFKSSRHPLLLFLVFFIPLLLETLSVRHPGPRYLVPFLPLIIIYSSLVLAKIPTLVILLSLPFGLSLLQILSPVSYFTFERRLIKYHHYDPYVCCFSTGYPLNQAVSYLKSLSQITPLYVGVYLGVGNPPSAILSYFRSDNRVTPLFMDSLLMGDFLTDIDCFTSKIPVYFLAIQEQQAGLNKYFEYVTTFTNPYGKDDYLNLYTLKKNCTGKSFEIDPVAQRP